MVEPRAVGVPVVYKEVTYEWNTMTDSAKIQT